MVPGSPLTSLTVSRSILSNRFPALRRLQVRRLPHPRPRLPRHPSLRDRLRRAQVRRLRRPQRQAARWKGHRSLDDPFREGVGELPRGSKEGDERRWSRYRLRLSARPRQLHRLADLFAKAAPRRRQDPSPELLAPLRQLQSVPPPLPAPRLISADHTAYNTDDPTTILAALSSTHSESSVPAPSVPGIPARGCIYQLQATPTANLRDDLLSSLTSVPPSLARRD